jgi:hypothetical protein
LIAADFPPEASARFFDVTPVGYQLALTEIKKTLKSDNKVDSVRMMNRLGKHFRDNYRAAETLAQEAR